MSCPCDAVVVQLSIAPEFWREKVATAALSENSPASDAASVGWNFPAGLSLGVRGCSYSPEYD